MNKDTENNKTLKGEVLDAIATGQVRQRPRWHFVLHSTFALVGTALLLLTLLYVASVIVFALRESGMWFVPSFGFRGWFAFFNAMPWFLILLAVVFVILLETLVRRYEFVYRKPLIVSMLTIVVGISLGGFALARTSMHESLVQYADGGWEPMRIIYRGPFKIVRPPDVYRGYVVATTSDGILIMDRDGHGTSTIIVTPDTRFPYGADYSSGSMVVVVGDDRGDGVVHAFGIRRIDSK